MPRVNWLLLVGVLLLVFMFRSSSDLAAAYVLAVAMTGWTAGILGFIVIWKLWRWSLWATIALMVPLTLVDTAFVMASTLKIAEGAWLPVLVGIILVIIMVTWRRGTRLLAQKTRRVEVPFEPLIKNLEDKPPYIAPGTAVFLTADPDFAPTALLHNLKHNKVLHEHNVILTIVNEDIPREDGQPGADGDRQRQVHGPHAAFRICRAAQRAQGVAIARKQGWQFDIMSTSFFLCAARSGQDVRSGMPQWQDQLFVFLAHNADDA